MVINTIDNMVKLGLVDLGYNYVNLDDCWSNKVRNNVTGRIEPDPVKFPRGIKYLTEYAHKRGMKFGIYGDIGTKTCGGYPGSEGNLALDVKTFMEWNVDLLKMDYCYASTADQQEPWKPYGEIHRAIEENGGNMMLSICQWGSYVFCHN
jgi:hypothetical protein